MDRTEFDRWAKHHAAAFPDWAHGVKASHAPIATMDAWHRVLAGTQLADAIQASDDMAAGTIDRPYRNEDHIRSIKSRAGEIAYHREESKRPPIRYGRERAFGCRLCLDTGWATIIHQKTAMQVRRGLFDDWIERQRIMHERRRETTDKLIESRASIADCMRTFANVDTGDLPKIRSEQLRMPYTAAALCCCMHGEYLAQANEKLANDPQRRHERLERYDPDRHVWIENGEELWQALERCKATKPKPANYCDDLDVYEY